MSCAQPLRKTHCSISRKICYIKSGFQILYAVEQSGHYFRGNFRLCNLINFKREKKGVRRIRNRTDSGGKTCKRGRAERSEKKLINMQILIITCVCLELFLRNSPTFGKESGLE